MITQEIRATKVPANRRLNFLPRIFGRYMMLGETLTYEWLAKLSEDYTGGYWEFYDLCNGGGYLAPAGPDKYRIKVDGNGYRGTLSADAAGIVASLFAIGDLANAAKSPDEADRLSGLYYNLLALVSGHAERDSIFQAID